MLHVLPKRKPIQAAMKRWAISIRIHDAKTGDAMLTADQLLQILLMFFGDDMEMICMYMIEMFHGDKTW